MKNQALFSLKDKSEKLKCRLLQFLFGALRVNQETAITNRCLGNIPAIEPLQYLIHIPYTYSPIF